MENKLVIRKNESKIIFITTYYKPPTNNMSLQLPGNSSQLPQGITLESLYQINDQSVWFLIWILKKIRFWPDLTKETLEIPFMVKREYWPSGPINHLFILKNNEFHGISCGWYENRQLKYEHSWKDDRVNGIASSWYESGQLELKECFKNGRSDGISYYWYENGQLKHKNSWKDGYRDGLLRYWDEYGLLDRESYWKNGQRFSYQKN